MSKCFLYRRRRGGGGGEGKGELFSEEGTRFAIRSCSKRRKFLFLQGCRSFESAGLAWNPGYSSSKPRLVRVLCATKRKVGSWDEIRRTLCTLQNKINP